jgi:hypothetical protein
MPMRKLTALQSRGATNSIIAAACAAALLAFASAAQASVATFDNRSDWAAAVSSPSTVNFNGFTGTDVVAPGRHYTEGGVAFDTQNGPIVGIGPLATNNGLPSGVRFPAGVFYDSGYLGWEANEANTLTITLPGAVHAIGFDFAEIFAREDTFTIVVGSHIFAVDASTTGEEFFGITDSDAFTTFTITNLSSRTNGIFNTPTIDDLSFAGDLAPETVAEPGSLFLFAAGAGVLFARRRRDCSSASRPQDGQRTRSKLRLNSMYVALACAVALSATPAVRAAAMFDNRATWTNALSSTPSTVSFDDFDSGGAADLGMSHAEGGVHFALSGGENAGTIFGIGTGLENVFKAGQFYGSGYLEWQSAQATNTLTITLSCAACATPTRSRSGRRPSPSRAARQARCSSG